MLNNYEYEHFWRRTDYTREQLGVAANNLQSLASIIVDHAPVLILRARAVPDPCETKSFCEPYAAVDRIVTIEFTSDLVSGYQVFGGTFSLRRAYNPDRNCDRTSEFIFSTRFVSSIRWLEDFITQCGLGSVHLRAIRAHLSRADGRHTHFCDIALIAGLLRVYGRRLNPTTDVAPVETRNFPRSLAAPGLIAWEQFTRSLIFLHGHLPHDTHRYNLFLPAAHYYARPGTACPCLEDRFSIGNPGLCRPVPKDTFLNSPGIPLEHQQLPNLFLTVVFASQLIEGLLEPSQQDNEFLRILFSTTDLTETTSFFTPHDLFSPYIISRHTRQRLHFNDRWKECQRFSVWPQLLSRKYIPSPLSPVYSPSSDVPPDFRLPCAFDFTALPPAPASNHLCRRHSPPTSPHTTSTTHRRPDTDSDQKSPKRQR
jgi:hypothetical protein